MKSFVKERDEAFTDFVLTGNRDKVIAFAKKYGVPIPRSERVFAGGIYKAVQECTSISEEVKKIAAVKCVELGFTPYM